MSTDNKSLAEILAARRAAEAAAAAQAAGAARAEALTVYWTMVLQDAAGTPPEPGAAEALTAALTTLERSVESFAADVRDVAACIRWEHGQEVQDAKVSLNAKKAEREAAVKRAAEMREEADRLEQGAEAAVREARATCQAAEEHRRDVLRTAEGLRRRGCPEHPSLPPRPPQERVRRVRSIDGDCTDQARSRRFMPGEVFAWYGPGELPGHLVDIDAPVAEQPVPEPIAPPVQTELDFTLGGAS